MPPTISTINPSQGPTTGGTTVTLTGTGMTGSTAVRFGSTNATSFTLNSATQITAVSPPRAAGAAAVIWVAEFTMNDVAGTPAKVTVVAPVNPVPVRVTPVPPDVGPLLGATPVTTGTWATT